MSFFPTPNLDIRDLPADVQHTGPRRPTSALKCIIVHSTEGRDSRKWLSTTSNPRVSIHRLIQRTAYNQQTNYGGHYKILADEWTAYHAGTGVFNHYGPFSDYKRNLNYVSLGVELERTGTESITAYQYEQFAGLVVEWWGLYGYLPVITHQDVDPSRRSDPVRFDWPSFSRVLFAKLGAIR
ncbi:MAG: N-acetylmuramoyl-L-alanine amidase [Chloroflexi bacterium]|nr:N-acetylmuramoyl-L-alanine amidase [Chloroflexota bacterium]